MMPNRNRPRSLLTWTFWLAASGALLAEGQTASFQKSERGIKLRVGTAEVELAVATAAAFRLSVTYQGKPPASQSTFLAPEIETGTTPWEVVHQDALVGISSAAGKLLIDPQSGQWTLEDARGEVLVPSSGLGAAATVPLPDKTQVPGLNLPVRWKGGLPVEVYGCGDGSQTLEQDNVRTRLGNGTSVLPYYWSPGGYAVMAVTGDDNQPACWSAGQGAIDWHFPGATADLYLMPAPTLEAACRDYWQLSGPAPVPPLWTLGYLQSRWGWKDEAEIEDTLKQFRTLHIPVDAFIFDFEWYALQPDYQLPADGTPDFNDFGWNPALFPHPAQQLAEYRAQGIHFVGIRKPRVGNSESIKQFKRAGWIEQNQGGEGYHQRDIDYANPAVRAWYASQSEALLKTGVNGWWNDEGEATYTTFYHWNEAEVAAFEKVDPGQRFWSLNRAYSPGMQRLGATAWTGDVKTSWEQFRRTCTDLLNYSVAGMPFCGCDIGGFALPNNGAPPLSPELLTRWMEAGVFFPIMRTHSTRTATPHFPWLFGPEAQAALTKTIDLRYRFLPYLYSLAYETHKTGVPMMRPLALDYPGDAQAANLSDQWTMGPGVMVAPIVQEGSTARSVYLPPGLWFAFESTATQPGNQTINATAKLDEIPLYVRAGTILPLGPVVQNTGELPGGSLDLQVYTGKDATFTLVEDDGETTDYNQGVLRQTVFSWKDSTGQLSWTTSGSYSGAHVFKQMAVTFFGPRGTKKLNVSLDDKGSVTRPSN
jgi:alpha-glucosidase